jgi:hypothetical protein
MQADGPKRLPCVGFRLCKHVLTSANRIKLQVIFSAMQETRSKTTELRMIYNRSKTLQACPIPLQIALICSITGIERGEFSHSYSNFSYLCQVDFFFKNSVASVVVIEVDVNGRARKLFKCWNR